MQELIQEIKKKKSLQNIDDKFIEEQLQEFFRKNQKLEKKYKENILKEKEKKQIIKEIRNILNRIYGTFWKDNKLSLASHQSTKERQKHYEIIYKKRF
jgi:prenyltransferase beta subunit